MFDFYWEFSNSYDEKKGICKVQLIKMYDLKEVHFILKINIEDEGLTLSQKVCKLKSLVYLEFNPVFKNNQKLV